MAGKSRPHRRLRQISLPCTSAAAHQPCFGREDLPARLRLLMNCKIISSQATFKRRFLPFKQDALQFVRQRLNREETQNPIMAGCPRVSVTGNARNGPHGASAVLTRNPEATILRAVVHNNELIRWQHRVQDPAKRYLVIANVNQNAKPGHKDLN